MGYVDGLINAFKRMLSWEGAQSIKNVIALVGFLLLWSVIEHSD